MTTPLTSSPSVETTTLPDTPTPQEWKAHHGRFKNPVLVATMCVAVTSGLQGVDPSLHSVAMPAAAQALGMSPSTASFLKSLGTILLSASMLGVGSIGDRLGRRKGLLIGTAGIALGSLITALSMNAWMFALGRAVTGIATAMSFAMCLAFLPTLHQPRHLPKAFGIFFGTGATLIVCATAVSGTIQGLFGWRFTYLVVGALCLIMTLVAAVVLPENRALQVGKFDTPGVILAAIGMVCLVYSIGRASVLGWSHPLVWGGLILAAIILGVFARWEMHTPTPAFPVELFKIPAFMAACLGGVLFNWADATLLGQYPALAIPHGVPAATVSVIVAVLYVGMIIGALAAGTAQTRFGISNRGMFTSGLLLCGAGLALQMLLRDPHDIVLPLISMIIVGFAVMWMQNPQSAVIMGSAPQDKLGAVGAVKPAVGQFGFGLGFALAGPLAAIFMDGPELTTHAYSMGLGVQALFFLFATVLIYLLMRPRNTDKAEVA